MKFKDIVFIVIIVAGFGFMYVLTKRETHTERDVAIDSLFRANKVLINFDSVRSSIEKKVIDSLSVRIDDLESRIQTNDNKINLIRKQNAILLEKYNSVIVSRPDF